MWVRHGVEWSDTQWILVQNEEVSVIFLFDKFPQELLIWSTKMEKKTDWNFFRNLPQSSLYNRKKTDTVCHKPDRQQVLYLRSSS